MQSQSATTAELSRLYDKDFFEWTRRNAQLLRAGKVRQSDIEHVAEKIEDLGKQDLKELHRRSRALLAHLLVGQVQPAKHAPWPWPGPPLVAKGFPPSVRLPSSKSSIRNF
jgi:hypothetical protein